MSALCDDTNWEDLTTFQIGAHNLQTIDTFRMDVRKKHPGKGVSGRLLDALKNEGYSAHGVSIGPMGRTTLASYDSPTLVMPTKGQFETYNPIEWVERKDEVLHSVTNTTALGSSRFSDLWGSGLREGIEENEFLKKTIGEVDLRYTYSPAFSLIERMIETVEERGVERELYFHEILGWDHHFDVVNSMVNGLNNVDNILKNFEANLKKMGRWDDVTLVIFSDFGRGEFLCII